MAKYEVNFSCGHTETRQLYGRERDRQRRIEWWEQSGLCEDCYQAEREKVRDAKAAESEAFAKERGLPDLVGTEKQIRWAQTLRREAFEVAEKVIDVLHDALNTRGVEPLVSTFPDATMESALKAIDDYYDHLSMQDKCSFWIDNRHKMDLKSYHGGRIQEFLKNPAEDRRQEKEIETDLQLRPKNPVTELVCKIRSKGDKVTINLPEKNDEFRQLVRFKLGYQWNGDAWERSFNKFSGPVEDRIVEAGNKIFNLGFIVSVVDVELRDRIIKADYEPEQTRWIKVYTQGKYKNWFAVSWAKDDSCYEAARKLNGSRYHKPSVAVPADNFEEVLDFAEQNGFKLSELAKELAENSRKSKESQLVASAVEKEEIKKVKPGDKPKKLKLEKVEVHEDLKD